MSKWFTLLAISLALSMLSVACGGADESSTPAQVQGPALVMFYTDN